MFITNVDAGSRLFVLHTQDILLLHGNSLCLGEHTYVWG